jgi:histone-arginine methyltransferase CARM1
MRTRSQASFFNQTLFGVDFTALAGASRAEAFEQPIVGLINPACLVAPEIAPRNFDFYSLSVEELQDFTSELDWYMPKTCLVHGVSESESRYHRDLSALLTSRLSRSQAGLI